MTAKQCSGRIFVIVGMQYGSEGKGPIVSYLAPLMSMGIRSGASNAGHTVYYGGCAYVMRQIPCAWVNPEATLIIGAGAIIHLDVFLNEIVTIEEVAKIRHRLFVDYRAHVVTEEHIRTEKRSGLAKRISSTSAISGEGIGAATAAKVMRSAKCVQAKQVRLLQPYVADTVEMINVALDRGEFVLLEGTQGIGLSLDYGQFPYVTSRDTSVAALAASVGISPHAFEIDVVGVTRSYPIRVAGNSGPFDKDSREITWEQLSRFAGASRTLMEQTSVTRRIRRVATFSCQGFKRAVRINRPTEIALTFADYLDWSVRNKEELTEPVLNFVSMLEDISGVPVSIVKTGPTTLIDYDFYRRNIIRRIDPAAN